MPDSPPDGSVPTDPDISLHRAGLMPAADGDKIEREFAEYRARADAAYLRDRANSEDWRKYYTPGHDEPDNS